CLAEDEEILCVNESAKQQFFDGNLHSFFSHSLWVSLQSRLATGKSFSEWLSIGQKEGFFFFHPVENGYWLVEYQWGRDEIFQRLSDIILDWEFPAAVIDLRQEISGGSLSNRGFSSLDADPDEILSRIKGFQQGEKYLSIPRKNGELAYYRPLFFPFHPRVEIVLVVLLEETEHVRKTFMVERVQQVLSEMIRLSEEIQQRLSGGLESFFEQYQLSERERKLVKMIQQGLSNEEIASALYVSLDTVKKGISQLYRKLGVNSRLELLQKILFPVSPKIPPKG
ncbi:MAG: LuxR C-terminal-related transcriptional regulator, partial [Brevinematales bacterium]